MKLWGGRFTKSTDSFTDHFHSSISFDSRMYKQDITGSIAHAKMLGKQGIIPAQDSELIQKTLLDILHDIEDGKVRRWGGKIPPNLKLPLRDGDIDRPDDENYQGVMFINATSKDAPQVVDRRKNRITDPMMVYSGCYCNVSVNMFPFNANGNRGVACGLGNVQFVTDGERLSGRASADSDFDGLGDGDFGDMDFLN